MSLVGDYEIGLTVWNEQGTRSCNTARLTLQVRPDPLDEFYVEYRHPYRPNRAYNEHPPYVYDGVSLYFQLKRTTGASWTSDKNVVPSPADELSRDWGTPYDDSHDPTMRRVMGGSSGPCYVSIEELEEGVTYVAGGWTGATGDGETDELPVTPRIRVFVDGEHRKTLERTIDKREQGTFLYEFFHLEKQDGEVDIEVSDRVNKNWPEP